MHPKLSTFLATGGIPKTSKERNLLLDLAKLELTQKTNTPANMITFKKHPTTGERLSLDEKELASYEASLKNEVTKADLPQRHFVAQTAGGFDQEAEKIKVASAQARALTNPRRKAPVANAEAKTPTVIHRASVPVAGAKPAPAPVITVLTTAAAFTKPQMAMLRNEWQTLSVADKARFLAEGGMLADTPDTVKPAYKNGNVTRAGFTAMSPDAKSAHCKANLPIVD